MDATSFVFFRILQAKSLEIQNWLLDILPFRERRLRVTACSYKLNQVNKCLRQASGIRWVAYYTITLGLK